VFQKLSRLRKADASAGSKRL
jgi:TIGR01125: MiaB-like tRNA modifying enzyme YliG, TIGR01125